MYSLILHDRGSLKLGCWWFCVAFLIFVIPYLLYLSGDVETNPGPPYELNISNFRHVQSLLAEAQNEWYNLGVQLGVSLTKLDGIRKDYSTTLECYTAMLKAWLKMIDPQPSWERLVQALTQQVVGHEGLAFKIAKQNSIYLPAPSLSVEVQGRNVATLDESYSMTCHVRGAEQFRPTITYQWQRDGVTLDEFSSSTLSFPSLSMSHGGRYSCCISLTSPLLKDPLTATSNSHGINPGPTAATVMPDASKLENYFLDLCDRTFAIIEMENISVDMFKARLSSIPVRNKQLHKDFLSSLMENLNNPTLGDIWTKLNIYCNFLNYSLLESLVKKFGDNTLKRDFSEFKKQMKIFRSKTRLCDFSEYIRQINESLSKEHLKDVVIKLDKQWDKCTLEDLENSRESIARKLFLPSYFFQVKDIKRGCISITWVTPATVAVSLKENMNRIDIKVFCKLQGILKVSVDDSELDCSSDGVDSNKLHSMSDNIDTDTMQGNISALEDKFAEMEEYFLNMILGRQITITDLRAYLSKLQGFEKIYCKIDRDSNIDSVWLRLTTFWDFKNYILFEKLVNELGDQYLKMSLEDYLKKIAEFRRNICLSDFSTYSIVINRNLLEDFSDFNVGLHQYCKVYTLEELDRLAGSIALKFSIPKYALILKTITPSILTVTWAIPNTIATLLRSSMTNTNMKAFLYWGHITSIKIGKYTVPIHSGRGSQPVSVAKFRTASFSKPQRRQSCPKMVQQACYRMLRSKFKLVIVLILILLTSTLYMFRDHIVL